MQEPSPSDVAMGSSRRDQGAAGIPHCGFQLCGLRSRQLPHRQHLLHMDDQIQETSLRTWKCQEGNKDGVIELAAPHD